MKMLAYLFVLFAVGVRFMPHPWAFTPVAAALLFFGARASRRAFWFPLVLLAASDIILTKVVYSYAFTWDHFVTWVWYAAILWLGTTLHDHAKPLPIIGAALASSVSFFVVSNFAVWAVWSDLYPRTLSGLVACYAAAVPYFRRGVEGDLLFTVVFFATPVALHLLSRAADRSGDRTAAV